jgi:hypothetical protein
MEFVRRAFTEFFKQLLYRKCVGCGKLYTKESMTAHEDGWHCYSCDNPGYKAYIDSVGI